MIGFTSHKVSCAKVDLRRQLLRQMELAVLRIFESVQRALPVLGVPVTALNARFVDYCWHGRLPMVRWPAGNRKWPKCAVFCAGPLLPKPVAWRELIPPPVFGSWETSLASCFPSRADFMVAVRGRKSYAQSPYPARGQALIFCEELTVPFRRRCPVGRVGRNLPKIRVCVGLLDD